MKIHKSSLKQQLWFSLYHHFFFLVGRRGKSWRRIKNSVCWTFMIFSLYENKMIKIGWNRLIRSRSSHCSLQCTPSSRQSIADLRKISNEANTNFWASHEHWTSIDFSLCFLFCCSTQPTDELLSNAIKQSAARIMLWNRIHCSILWHIQMEYDFLKTYINLLIFILFYFFFSKHNSRHYHVS